MTTTVNSQLHVVTTSTSPHVTLRFKDHKSQPRNLHRPVAESIHKTLARLLKTFKAKKSSVTISLHGQQGIVANTTTTPTPTTTPLPPTPPTPPRPTPGALFSTCLFTPLRTDT